MEGASAGIVFTGERGGNGTGQGAAAILPKPTDRADYFRILEAQRQQELNRLEQQRKAKEKDWLLLQKDLDAGNVWNKALPDIQNKISEAEAELVDLKMKGFDPADAYGQAGRRYRELTNELAAMKRQAETTENVFNETVQLYRKNPQGYYADDFEDWIKGMEGLSLSELEQHVKLSKPLVPVVTDAQVIKQVGIKPSTKVEEDGTVTETMVAVDKPEFIESVVRGATGGDPAIEINYQKGVKQGFWKTPEEYANKLYAKNPLAQKRVQDEPRAVSASSSSGGGGTSKKVDLTPSLRDVEGLKRGVNVNVVRAVRTGTQDDLPQVEVSSLQGVQNDKGIEKDELIRFQPTEFVLGSNGKIGVRGKKIILIPTTGGGTTTKEEEMWVDYDRNKSLFEGQLGTDLYKYFDELNGGGSAPAKSTKSKTTSGTNYGNLKRKK